MAINPDEIANGALYRHKKTGNTYQVIMTATLERTMEKVVVYAARKGNLVERWVRPIDEFCDGRFEPVDMSANQ